MRATTFSFSLTLLLRFLPRFQPSLQRASVVAGWAVPLSGSAPAAAAVRPCCCYRLLLQLLPPCVPAAATGYCSSGCPVASLIQPHSVSAPAAPRTVRSSVPCVVDPSRCSLLPVAEVVPFAAVAMNSSCASVPTTTRTTSVVTTNNRMNPVDARKSTRVKHPPVVLKEYELA